MKRLMSILLIATISASVFAGTGEGKRKNDYSDAYAEIELFLEDEKDTPIGDLTVGAVTDLLGRVSVELQEASFIRHSQMASKIIPGMGQFMNGEALSGTLFLLSDIVLVAGTLVGSYFLLPAELQINPFDHLNDPIGQSWEDKKALFDNVTRAELLPSMGVLAGGIILKHILGSIAGHNAANLARQRIESGDVTFEPKLLMINGHSGFGMSMRH